MRQLLHSRDLALPQFNSLHIIVAKKDLFLEDTPCKLFFRRTTSHELEHNNDLPEGKTKKATASNFAEWYRTVEKLPLRSLVQPLQHQDNIYNRNRPARGGSDGGLPIS